MVKLCQDHPSLPVAPFAWVSSQNLCKTTRSLQNNKELSTTRSLQNCATSNITSPNKKTTSHQKSRKKSHKNIQKSSNIPQKSPQKSSKKHKKVIKNPANCLVLPVWAHPLSAPLSTGGPGLRFWVPPPNMHRRCPLWRWRPVTRKKLRKGIWCGFFGGIFVMFEVDFGRFWGLLVDLFGFKWCLGSIPQVSCSQKNPSFRSTEKPENF